MFDPTRPLHFNPWLQAEGEGLRSVVSAVKSQLLAHDALKNPRLRARRPADLALFHRQAEALVVNLARAEAMERTCAVTRSKRILARGPRRYRHRVMVKSLPKVIDLLVATGFAVEQRGKPGLADLMQTELSPTARLSDTFRSLGITLDEIGREAGEELVILKSPKDDDDTAELIDYTDSALTRAYRTEMRCINEWLASLDIEYRGEGIDVGERFMVRRFTCGSFDSGGRLWGGFWMNLPKRQRLNLTELDGGPVVSLDHSAMGVRLVYSMAQATMPEGDAYAVDGVNLSRETLKRLMASCLFAQRPFTRWPRSLAEEARGVPVTKAVDVLRARHPAIADRFFTAIGHRAQFTESEIMLDTLAWMMDAGIPALPVHDALVVPVKYARDAEIGMEESFRLHVWGGVSPHIKAELN